MKKIIPAIILAILLASCGQAKKPAPVPAQTQMQTQAQAQAQPQAQPVRDIREIQTGLIKSIYGHWEGASRHIYFNKDKTFRTVVSGKPWTYGNWMITGVNEVEALVMVYLYSERHYSDAGAGETPGQEVYWFHLSKDRRKITAYDEWDKEIKDNLSLIGK